MHEGKSLETFINEKKFFFSVCFCYFLFSGYRCGKICIIYRESIYIWLLPSPPPLYSNTQTHHSLMKFEKHWMLWLLVMFSPSRAQQKYGRDLWSGYVQREGRGRINWRCTVPLLHARAWIIVVKEPLDSRIHTFTLILCDTQRTTPHRRDNILSTKAWLSTGIYKLQNFLYPFLHSFPFPFSIPYVLSTAMLFASFVRLLAHLSYHTVFLIVIALVVVIRFGYAVSKTKLNWTKPSLSFLQVDRFYLLNVFWLGISTNFVLHIYIK